MEWNGMVYEMEKKTRQEKRKEERFISMYSTERQQQLLNMGHLTLLYNPTSLAYIHLKQ